MPIICAIAWLEIGSSGALRQLWTTAIVGFEQLGLAMRAADLPDARVYHPDARTHAVYRRAADRQQRLLRALC